MAMGSTGTVNITPEMMQNALAAVEDYRTKSANLNKELGETVENLIPANFSGSAADGFKFFYTSKIEPAVGEELTKLLNTLKDMFDATLKAIPGDQGIDEQLASENRK
jgi:uncharacterized protein YukE